MDESTEENASMQAYSAAPRNVDWAQLTRSQKIQEKNPQKLNYPMESNGGAESKGEGSRDESVESCLQPVPKIEKLTGGGTGSDAAKRNWESSMHATRSAGVTDPKL